MNTLQVCLLKKLGTFKIKRVRASSWKLSTLMCWKLRSWKCDFEMLVPIQSILLFCPEAFCLVVEVFVLKNIVHKIFSQQWRKVIFTILRTVRKVHYMRLLRTGFAILLSLLTSIYSIQKKLKKTIFAHAQSGYLLFGDASNIMGLHGVDYLN